MVGGVVINIVKLTESTWGPMFGYDVCRSDMCNPDQRHQRNEGWR